ncbi:hypothetical protein [Spirulina sp. CS-785/01]|uniref:hypothetical protein n=1 Tax=Spirulina sp. CS-785/01 TaxID=3021716 RepID=UPI003FA73D24
MSYLVAVLRDRLEAEAAYTALEKAGFESANVSILGRGYQSADEFGLVDPGVQARKRATLMAFWLVPFGFFAGATFNLISHLNLITWTGEVGNTVIGGILGALGGAMGSYFIGGGINVSDESGEALPYRNSLEEGKYLVIVRGSTTLKNRAKPILQQFEPEELQGYTQE